MELKDSASSLRTWAPALSALLIALLLFFEVPFMQFISTKDQIEGQVLMQLADVQTTRHAQTFPFYEPTRGLLVVDTLEADTSVFAIIGIGWVGNDSAEVYIYYQDEEALLADFICPANRTDEGWIVSLDSVKLRQAIDFLDSEKELCCQAVAAAWEKRYPSPDYRCQIDSSGRSLRILSAAGDTVISYFIKTLEWNHMLEDTAFVVLSDEHTPSELPAFEARHETSVFRENGSWLEPDLSGLHGF